MIDTTAKPLHYAGFWKRFWAYGYDSTIIAILAFIVGAMIDPAPPPGADDMTQQLEQFQTMLDASGDPGTFISTILDSMKDGLRDALLFSAPYNILFLIGPWQATPGKRFCGIKVVAIDGGKISLKQSILRHIMSGVSMAICGLGFLPIFYTKEKTAWHDMICETRVIYDNRVRK